MQHEHADGTRHYRVYALCDTHLGEITATPVVDDVAPRPIASCCEAIVTLPQELCPLKPAAQHVIIATARHAIPLRYCSCALLYIRGNTRLDAAVQSPCIPEDEGSSVVSDSECKSDEIET